MNVWQDIGFGLEAKLAVNNSVWVRNQGQTNEYPHLLVDFGSQGNITSIRPSDSRASIGSFDGLFLIATLVKERILQNNCQL